MLDITLLATQLLDVLRPEARCLGLHGELRADYVENPGNLQNANFTVADGRTRLHVKLSPEAERPW